MKKTASIDDIVVIEGAESLLSELVNGGEVDTLEKDNIYISFTPVFNEEGNLVAYSCARASLVQAQSYMGTFTLQVLIVFAGFLILIVAYGMCFAGYNMIFPIESMVTCTDNFIQEGSDQQALDSSVRKLRSLNIRTGDEIEDLYLAICKMASDMTEQMRELRYYSEATAQMQNGLIITMADMVESRDSDTGAHVQKTAAYVKIILDGLKRKGYYAEKLTPKYMMDVVMSAPLHDVGKISISDTVLNKPGKLTDEEYEIMKTHTTAGKLIIEKAISTAHGESYLREARNMAGYHHERWDGKGYPEGLHGEIIPLSARIMAVADVFDALTSSRVYKPAFPLEKAVSIIKEGSGTQFDPKCVEVFFESMTEVKKVLRKYNEQEGATDAGAL